MSNHESLICGYRIDRLGRSIPVTWDALDAPPSNDAWMWLHFDVQGTETRRWLENSSGLDQYVVAALLSEETRPRATLEARGAIIILRGVNLQPDADPTDMISIRLWVEPNRIISTRIRRLLSVQAIRMRYDAGDGPKTVGDFIVDLNNGLIERMSGVIHALDEEIDELEQLGSDVAISQVRAQLASTRRKIIPLRRFLSPQRDALSQLLSFKTEWMNDSHRGQLRECADRLTRFIEELDSMREKATVLQDLSATLLSEQMNRTMLLLSIVAAIFLPLGLLTGLLGINVDGIPGAKTPSAFWIVILIMLAIAALEVWLINRLRLTGGEGDQTKVTSSKRPTDATSLDKITS